MNALEVLQQHSHIVADTGDLNEIKHWLPEEATTNPTLILKVFQKNEADKLIKEAQTLCTNPNVPEQVAKACAVIVAQKISSIISGRISVEIDAHLSFNTPAMVEEAQMLIQLIKQAGINPQKILIKIASTWEGIQAARILEKQGIHCNCTLIFSSIQALACAQANVTLISPFVGRIYDWYKQHDLWQPGMTDPGVESVKTIYQLLKSQNYSTEIMGASFRNVEEILALAGCDRLTIAPKFLQQLSDMDQSSSLQPLSTPAYSAKQSEISEAEFRWAVNENPMVTEKLSEGIRLFARDGDTLVQTIRTYLQKL